MQHTNPQIDTPDEPVRPVARAQSLFPPDPSYDGPSFLRDRPVYLDPEQVPVTEVVRFLGPAGLIPQTDPLALQPNPFYQPTLPITD